MNARRFFFVIPLGALLYCANPQLVGPGEGNASETIARGVIADSTGMPIAGAVVNLLPVRHDPVSGNALPDAWRCVTGPDGIYLFKNVTVGVYNVEAFFGGNGFRCLETNIPVLDMKNEMVFNNDTLRPPGAITVLCSDTASAPDRYVFVPGTSRFGRVRDGIARIDSVPAGLIPAVCYADTADTTMRHVVGTNVVVRSGETTLMTDSLDWRYSRKLFLNTAASGANVRGNVSDFPALIRLTKGNFDFSLAQGGGADIRFSKADGATRLPYEIERWDSAGGRAEIWVNIDTVYGNNDKQYIIMYWGAPAAPSMSLGPAVFDTAKGFQGVWHLSGSGNEIAKDATANHYDGTPSDTAPQGVEGTIGPCRSFNGSSNYIRMNGTADSKLNFQENDIFTVSAWAYADTIDYNSHLIVGKSNEQYFMKFKASLINDPMVWEFVEYHDKTGWYITNSLPIIPSAKSWVNIVGVHKGATQFFYLNGVLVDSSISVTSSNVPSYTGEDVTIGRFISTPPDSIEGKCPFLGKIDEVRISNVACSADWIKLCYMNQKQQDALVVFK